ncbi:hypothetical protein [Archangium minus]|uniref:hypothetical protein n=1 Tax=Archangium minus TaxID=83450 RepID=UPI0037C077A7
MAPQPPVPPPETPLQKNLRRLLEAIAEGQQRHAEWKEKWARYDAREKEMWARQQAEGWEQWAQRQAQGVEKWAQGVEKWAEGVEKWADHLGKRERRKMERRMHREMLREQRRALKRQRQAEEANPLMGWVFALAAMVMVGMALLQPDKWWLIFVALGMGAASAGILGQVQQNKKRARLQQGQGTAPELEEAQSEAPVKPVASGKTTVPSASEDPRTARVDALCDKLLAELRAGPGVLRDVVHQPEQTVDALRKSCHELARRERELRSLSTPEDERRLEEEHAKLAARVESERDAVVKERLEKTLRLLDEQRGQRAELATAASRLEAEHMRLYYTLENLYTQVLRVRSADTASADVAGAGLRRSVEQLGLEMDAVAEALEEVHQDAPRRERVPTR